MKVLCHFFAPIRPWRWLLTLIIVVATAVAVWKCVNKGDKPSFSIDFPEGQTIDATAEEIRAIRDIGQWEFLTIDTEELAELREERLLGDRQLVRIYHGTLRIGVDMERARNDWFKVGDAGEAILHLPDVGLLDEHFIDEGHSRPLIEKGVWGPSEREKLYDQARKKMKQRVLIPENMERARLIAIEEFTKVFKALGFERVEVIFV